MVKINKTQVQHIAKLANIPVSDEESEKLAEAFSETLLVVDSLNKADTKNVAITHQVTGFKNIFREDKVIEENSLTQAEALANAKHSYNGYFVVPMVLENKDN